MRTLLVKQIFFGLRCLFSIFIFDQSFSKEIDHLNYFNYFVKPQDTLYNISKQFKVDLDKLRRLNQKLDEHQLQVGQKIILSNYKGVFYRIQKGDTIYSLSKKYSFNKSLFIKLNNVQNNKLYVQQKVFLPVKKVGKKNKETLRYKRNLARRKGRKSKFIKISFNNKPISGKLISKVGYRFHPIRKKTLYHSGIDIKAYYGKRVYSTGYGRVKFSGYVRGYGRLIIIDHQNGWETYYGHLSKIYVRKNQRVSPKKVIGRVGQSGNTTGPHLHFEIRYRGKPQKILDNNNIPHFRGELGYHW